MKQYLTLIVFILSLVSTVSFVDADKKLLCRHEHYFIMTADSRNVLDIANASQAENAAIILWRYLRGSNQQWILERVRP